MIIYHYDYHTGCLVSQSHADNNQLDDAPLLPVFSTETPPPSAIGPNECARYLTATGDIPTCQNDGKWIIHSDWRGVPLWGTNDGQRVEITEPNVTPEQICATAIRYPGPGYVWLDSQWQEDPALKYQLAEQAAEQELSQRQAEATTEIERIQPAVDGGYAKPEDIELLPQLQRYLYELPDVRGKPGWPESPQWSEKPGAAV